MTEPAVDEAEFEKFQRARKVSALIGHRVEGDGCGNCYYYLEPADQISFCWHEKLQILVGSEWWCHYWEMTDD